MEPTVRPLETRDFEGWLSLWDAYNAFYRNELPDDVTRETFRRLDGSADGLYGLVAESEGGLVGFAHAVFHPSTWTAGEYCYLEDLFVARSGRGTGVARRLVEGVYGEADRRGADRVYWHTDAYNAPARSLYDSIGRLRSYVVYER
jgi:GNAT superfamily N-acetyltransferase